MKLSLLLATLLVGASSSHAAGLSFSDLNSTRPNKKKVATVASVQERLVKAAIAKGQQEINCAIADEIRQAINNDLPLITLEARTDAEKERAYVLMEKLQPIAVECAAD